MKVLCIKDTIGFKKGKEYMKVNYLQDCYEFIQGESGENKVYLPTEDFYEYFQEVKEEDKPRWKIGDKIVIDKKCDGDYTVYSVITTIVSDGEKIKYSITGLINIDADELRKPTEEELEKFFM